MALANMAEYSTIHTPLQIDLRERGHYFQSHLRHEAVHLLYCDLVAVFCGFSELRLLLQRPNLNPINAIF